MGGEFSQNTIRILAKRAGERCSLCGESTSKPNLDDPSAYINLGEAAHIHGNKRAKHSRYNEEMNDTQRSVISNAIWVCTSCHKEIDSNSEKFTVEYLVETKRLHENKIYLKEFDVNWQEWNSLKMRVAELEELIRIKNGNYQLLEFKIESELNSLRVELEKTLIEKAEFERSLALIKETIAGLDFENPSDNTKMILNAYKEGDIEKVKQALDETVLISEEYEIARKRLLKANICEIEKEFHEAELNYEKAATISSTKEYFEYHIGFLKRIGKQSKAIDLCLLKLKEGGEISFIIWINSALADLYSSSNLAEQAVQYFEVSKSLIVNELAKNPAKFKLDKAKISSALGIARKNLGDYDQALKDFEESLNDFWNMSINDGITHVQELGILFNSIGLLYLQHKHIKESKNYLLKARDAFKEAEFKDDYLLATVYLNLVDLYTYNTEETSEARKYIVLAKELIAKGFNSRPLQYLEYFIGVCVKSADHYFHSGKFKEAEDDYLMALNVGERFKEDYGVVRKSILAITYCNYGVFLKFQNRNTEALDFIDQSISIYSSFNESEEERKFNLAKLNMLKSDIVPDPTLKKVFARKAQEQIMLCKDHPSVNFWKTVIEQMVERL